MIISFQLSQKIIRPFTDSFEPNHKKLQEYDFHKTLKHKGLIRELHVYGSTQGVSDNNKDALRTQHLGVGRRLLKKAEDIMFYKHLCSGTVVIFGICVRGYYEKFGYKLENNYMVKEFNQMSWNLLPCF